MSIRKYQDLIAWQKAVELTVNIYRVTAEFPRQEIYGLTNQMRRAAVSIASNIAEGQGRGTTKDFCHFLCIALGSVQEIETQLIISHRLDYLVEPSYSSMLDQVGEVGRITNGLLSSLRQKLAQSSSH